MLSPIWSWRADYVSPVCLPFTEMLPRTHTQDTDATDPEVAGWGAVDVLARRFADVLQYVVVPFSDTTNCTRIYKVWQTWNFLSRYLIWTYF